MVIEITTTQWGATFFKTIFISSENVASVLRQHSEKRLFFPDGTARSVEFQPKYLMHVYAVVVLACEHWAERGVETEAHESHWQRREEELHGPRQRGESRGSQAGEEEKNRGGNNKLIGLMADDWKEERTSQFRNMQNVLHTSAPWDNVRWKMSLKLV